MRSFIIFLVTCTTLMGSFGTALDEEDFALHNKVVECISAAFHADLAEEHVPMATAFCDTFKAKYTCFTKPFDFESDSAALDFYRVPLLYTYLLNKVNMCGEALPFQDLKDLVEKSGEGEPPDPDTKPPPITAKPPPPGCRDTKDYCAGQQYFCHKIPTFKKECPKTCNDC